MLKKMVSWYNNYCCISIITLGPYTLKVVRKVVVHERAYHSWVCGLCCTHWASTLVFLETFYNIPLFVTSHDNYSLFWIICHHSIKIFQSSYLFLVKNWTPSHFLFLASNSFKTLLKKKLLGLNRNSKGPVTFF